MLVHRVTKEWRRVDFFPWIYVESTDRTESYHVFFEEKSGKKLVPDAGVIIIKQLLKPKDNEI